MQGLNGHGAEGGAEDRWSAAPSSLLSRRSAWSGRTFASEGMGWALIATHPWPVTCSNVLGGVTESDRLVVESSAS